MKALFYLSAICLTGSSIIASQEEQHPLKTSREVLRSSLSRSHDSLRNSGNKLARSSEAIAIKTTTDQSNSITSMYSSGSSPEVDTHPQSISFQQRALAPFYYAREGDFCCKR